MIPTLHALFHRDLTKLYNEISAYRDEANLWRTEAGINNSGGTLCLHLVGNLNTFLGAQIGGTAYVRDRPAEFNRRDVPKQELLRMVEETRTVVAEALEKLTVEQLAEEYPILVFREKTTTEFFLFHLTTHLTYHLGQINYHRRLLDVEE